MAPLPNRTLAARFPDVAATWHPTANDHLGQDPHTIAASSPVKVLWRCPAGHEWSESPGVRIALPEWKNGDRAACRVCVGYLAIITFSCGHTAEAKTDYARAAATCPACRNAAWQQRDELFRQRGPLLRAANAAAKDEAEQLVRSVTVPPGLPRGLVTEWRIDAVLQLRHALAAERVLGQEQQVTATLRRLTDRLPELVPSRETLEAALARNEPISLFEKAQWPTGWLHLSYEPPPVPAHLEGGDDATVTSLERALREELQQQRAQLEQAQLHQQSQQQSVAGGDDLTPPEGPAPFSTVQLTRILTDATVRWAGKGDTVRGASAEDPGEGDPAVTPSRPYRELSVPVTPTGKERFGRLDVTVLRLDAPDVVVEIDSAANAGAQEKLTFARDAGALTVWVRWKGGSLTPIEGVHLIDLREATRGLVRPSRVRARSTRTP